MRHGLTRWLAPLAVLAAAGCVSLFTDPMGRHRALEETQRSYTNMIRWGDIERASELVDPAAREEFLGYLPAFKQIRITDFEIGKLAYLDGGATATVTVTYRGYSLASFVETPIREEQEWRRQGMSNVWRVRPQIEGIVGAFPGATR